MRPEPPQPTAQPIPRPVAQPAATPSDLPRRTRVAAYVACVEDGRLLLTRLSADGVRWTLPGGGVDFGEDPADAARREVAEETGLTAELGAVLGVDSLRRVMPELDGVPGPWDAHGIRVVWRGRVTGGRLRHEVGGSTDQAQWWPLADVPGLPHVELVDAVLGWLAADARSSGPGPRAEHR